MATERIYHLLHNVKDKTDTTNYFLQLDKDYVKTVAENLCSLISDKDKTNYILFIRNFCKQTVGHLNLNETNYIEFLNWNVWNENDCKEFKELEQQTKSEEIIKFYSDQLLRHQNKQENIDYITDYTINSFKEFDYTQSKKLENHAENYQLITNLLDDDKDVNTKEKILSTYEENQHREASIKLGYSVLILNPPQCDLLIRNILSKLISYSPLKQYERDFVKYIFINHNNHRIELIEKFPFLFEIPIIQICTDALKNDIMELISDHRIEYLMKFIEAKQSIKFKILHIAYELFALSNYDDCILKVITFIEKKLVG